MIRYPGILMAIILLGIYGMARAEDEPFQRPFTLSQSAPTTQGTGESPSNQPLPPAEHTRLRSFELPAVTVVGEKPSDLHEEDRIGPYQQPRWTATRRFPNTRIYVIPENQIEVEYWIRPTFDRDGTTEIRSLYEIEFGLPYRFQVDLYYRSDQLGTEDYNNGAQFEMRWAFADWGKIWGNPTIYLEYAPLQNAPDRVEARLLLGDELAPRWHWGVNLNVEAETGGEQEIEYQISSGLSYTVIDEKFGVGIEAKALFTDSREHRWAFEDQYLVGPSIQFRPMPQWTINISPLLGIGPHSPDSEITFNMGYEF